MRDSKMPSGGSRAAGGSRFWSEAWPFMLLGAFSLFVMRRLLSPGRLPFGHDLVSVFFDMRSFGFRSILEGHLPLWNPYIMCGTPFVAGMQSALFYPLNIIFLIMPAHLGISLSIVSHLFIAASGMYLLIRIVTGLRPAGLISGISYGFSGLYVSKIFAGHLAPILIMAWVPCLVLSAELFMRSGRWRWAVCGGIVIGIQALAGHPMYATLSALVGLLYVSANAAFIARSGRDLKVVRRALLFVTACAVVGLGLGAIQILPGHGLIGNTNRTMTRLSEWVMYQSFPPENLLMFLVPEAFGHYGQPWAWLWPEPSGSMADLREMARHFLYWGRGYSWEVFPYFGIVPLLLAGVALARRRDRFFWGMCAIFVVGLICALGSYTLPSRWAINLMSWAGLVRCPGRFLLLCTFGGAGMAGIGAAQCSVKMGWGNGRGVKFAALLALAGFGLAGAHLLWLTGPRGQESWMAWMRSVVSMTGDRKGAWVVTSGLAPEARRAFLESAWISWGLAAAATASIFLAAWHVVRPGVIAAALVLMTALDLGRVSEGFVLSIDSSLLRWPPRIVTHLRENLGKHRIAFFLEKPDRPQSAYQVNRSIYYRLAAASGYDAFILRRTRELANRSEGSDLNLAMQELWITRITPITRLMGVKYLLIPSHMSPDLTQRVLEEDGLSLHETSGACPRAFVVHDYVVEADRQRALDFMMSESFDPRKIALLEEEPPIRIAKPENERSEAEIVDEGPNHVSIRARLLSNGVLILTDAFYPGWKAVVNHKPHAIARADWAFRGLVLPAGDYDIKFLFRPLSFYAGAAISAATVLALSVWATVLALRRGRG